MKMAGGSRLMPLKDGLGRVSSHAPLRSSPSCCYAARTRAAPTARSRGLTGRMFLRSQGYVNGSHELAHHSPQARRRGVEDEDGAKGAEARHSGRHAGVVHDNDGEGLCVPRARRPGRVLWAPPRPGLRTSGSTAAACFTGSTHRVAAHAFGSASRRRRLGRWPALGPLRPAAGGSAGDSG